MDQKSQPFIRTGMAQERSIISVAVFLALFNVMVTSCASTGSKTQLPAQVTDVADAPQFEWPQRLQDDERTITIYQPQVEKWENNQLVERMAVSVGTSESSRPVYGLLWVSARTSIGKESGLVDFKDARVVRASFPSAPELTQPTVRTVEKNISRLLQPMPQEQLRRLLAVSEAEAARKDQPLKNEPPRILVSTSPAYLVLVDGDPVLRETGSEGLLRVINTPALILLDRGKGIYYFYMGDRWMEAPSLQGAWSEAKSPPSSLDEAKRQAVERQQVDLLDDKGSSLMKELRAGVVPKVLISTEPALLLQTRGAPKYESIEGTQLLFVENSEGDIFLHEKDQKYYVLLAGRWYRADTLKGPWKYRSAKDLPPDFAKIPENHRKGSVLASVAGTPQAKEAAIASEVPQTARVNRDEATLTVNYDGKPRFEPVRGTSLHYAVNTTLPVIRVGSDDYYAVRAGVWFHSKSPHGAWNVATSVPAEIYKIPPSSPLYHVTHVRIYGSTPHSVYEGYTPGYLGSYCCNDGVVVYGTGYYYPPWIGSYWIGSAITFGYSPWWEPWWDPWWGWPAIGYYPYAVPVPTTPAPAPGSAPPDVYGGWSGQGVHSAGPAEYNAPFESQPGWGSAPAPDIAPWNPPPAVGAGSWGPPVNVAPPPAAAAPAPAPAAPAAPPAISQPFPGGGWGPSR